MKTAVIYARYSSDSQTEQSIEGQLRVCQQYAKNNDIVIVGEYIDRAMTGTNDLRPDFQRMIKDSNKKQWDYVLVYKLDRFSRDKYETTIHKHTLKNNGVKVISAMENIPDTPEGIILESMLEGMNQYYSAELSQKVHRGLNESYIKGLFTGGHQIYGYDIVDKKSVINEEEAMIVKEIFSKFAQGFTGVDIAKNLQARGIRTKTGNYLTDKAIYKIIQNTKYIGKVKHGETVYTNIYPAIIDEQVWQKVQNIRNAYKHAHCRKQDIYNYILSGKLICGYCKHKMVGESGKEINKIIKYRYYTCLTKRRRKNEKCELQICNKENLEKDVIDITWRVLSNNNNLKIIAKSILQYHEKVTRAESNLKSLETQRASYLKATQNLITAIEQGIITEQTKIRLKELESQISQLDYDIEQEKQRNYTYLTEDLIIDYFKKIICGDIENIEIQKSIVKTFIREILLYNDKIIIVYNFTEPLPSKANPLDNVQDLESKSLDNTTLLTEEEINNNADLSFFCDNQYFAVISKRTKT